MLTGGSIRIAAKLRPKAPMRPMSSLMTVIAPPCACVAVAISRVTASSISTTVMSVKPSATSARLCRSSSPTIRIGDSGPTRLRTAWTRRRSVAAVQGSWLCLLNIRPAEPSWSSSVSPALRQIWSTRKALRSASLALTTRLRSAPAGSARATPRSAAGTALRRRRALGSRYGRSTGPSGVPAQCAATPSHSSGHVGSTPASEGTLHHGSHEEDRAAENTHGGRLAQAHEEALAPVPYHGERDGADSREPDHVADHEPREESRRRHGLDLEQLAVAGDEREPEQGKERVEEAEREAERGATRDRGRLAGHAYARGRPPGRDGIDEEDGGAAGPERQRDVRIRIGADEAPQARRRDEGVAEDHAGQERDELGEVPPRDEIEQDEVDRAERHRREDPADE